MSRREYNMVRAFRKHLRRHPVFNGAAYRNAIQQAAHQHKTSERRVRAAIHTWENLHAPQANA